MIRRIAVVFAGICLLAAPVSAQVFEASISGGYTASEGVSVEDRDILGQIYSDVDVKSGSSFTLTAGGFVSPRALIEFMWARQSSTLRASGNTSLDVSDLNVDNYHGNFVYHWGTDRVQPFAFAGLGATHYSFGDILLAGATLSVDNDTKFSTTWGGGVKFFIAPAIGLKVQARWTPTYIKSTAEGYWCDPFYGCWLLGDPDYSHQFDISGGVTFRF